MNVWPHAPLHFAEAKGAYMVTAGTYGKLHHFREAARLGFLHDKLLTLAAEYGWQLQAWAVFSNHYHFIAISDERSRLLRQFIQTLHSQTALHANELDGAAGRQVWFQYWDTLLTFERSYLARLNYVHQNPVRHGLVRRAANYPWCSAGWFELRAAPAFFKAVSAFKTDRINVRDDFAVEWDGPVAPAAKA